MLLRRKLFREAVSYDASSRDLVDINALLLHFLPEPALDNVDILKLSIKLRRISL
jgi:hypothetical protein